MSGESGRPLIVETSRRLGYNLICRLLQGISRVYFRHQTFGLQHIPEDSGAVLATNHASHLDVPLVGIDVPRVVHTMAKKALHDIPVFGPFINFFYSFPVRRGVVDRKALRKAVRILSNGGLLMLFPEGRRTRDGNLQKGRAGIGKIVLEAGVPVIPGYVSGSYCSFPPGSFFPWPTKTKTTFGPPLRFPQKPVDSHSREDYEQVVSTIMNRIRRLRDRYTNPPST